MAVLQAERLWVERKTPAGPQPVLRGINLDLPEGAITVLLGETGAGKSTLGRALAGLLPDGFRQSSGRVLYRGRELDSPTAWSGVRGKGIFYSPQNAAACFNPVQSIGRQLRECSHISEGGLMHLLFGLRFPDPARILRSYAHELSGGENQRGLLALALAACPDVLILDEPTSELDADARGEFMRVLIDQQRGRSLTVLLISHHLGYVREIAAHLGIMSRGELVATGEPRRVLASSDHPYTREIVAYMAGE